MPIEIKELHIKVNVEDDRPSAPENDRQTQLRKGNDNDEIIDGCVEKVLEVLKQKSRR